MGKYLAAAALLVFWMMLTALSAAVVANFMDMQTYYNEGTCHVGK